MRKTAAGTRTIMKLIPLMLVLFVLCGSAGCKNDPDGPSWTPSVPQQTFDYDEETMSGTIINTEFEPGVIKTLEELGMSRDEFTRGGGKGDYSYDGNRGCDYLSVIFSPDYTLKVNGADVPVYSTIVHDGTFGKNILYSFAIIEVKAADALSLKAELTPKDLKIKSAVVLPEAKGIAPEVTSDSRVRTVVKEFGNFTVLVDEKAKTDFTSDFTRTHSFTLFVREYTDEDAEIAAYRAQYGEENVTVYEPGLHVFDYINVSKDDQVLYFRRGCYMFSKGREDYGEKNDYFEKHRGDDITWNLLRFPVINANYRKNVTVAGSGWIDAGGLGWHERRGLMFSNCDGVCVKDVTLINFPEWTLITYVSANIDISDCRIFGYKSNSDGFAICNSKNARITDCFARSGDDLFEIKTLGGPAGSVADNVVFTSCTAWASKARCFGIIAETEFPVSNITFRDCYVIYRDSTWDNEFLGSLMVYCELSKNGVTIDNILFENIEIFYDRGRAINVKMEDDKAPTQVTNVTFRNVRYRSELKNLLYNPSGIRTGNYVQEITLENVTANGKLIGPGDDLGKLFDMTGSGEISVVRNEV